MFLKIQSSSCCSWWPGRVLFHISFIEESKNKRVTAASLKKKKLNKWRWKEIMWPGNFLLNEFPWGTYLEQAGDAFLDVDERWRVCLDIVDIGNFSLWPKDVQRVQWQWRQLRGVEDETVGCRCFPGSHEQLWSVKLNNKKNRKNLWIRQFFQGSVNRWIFNARWEYLCWNKGHSWISNSQVYTSWNVACTTASKVKTSLELHLHMGKMKFENSFEIFARP